MQRQIHTLFNWFIFISQLFYIIFSSRTLKCRFFSLRSRTNFEIASVGSAHFWHGNVSNYSLNTLFNHIWKLYSFWVEIWRCSGLSRTYPMFIWNSSNRVGLFFSHFYASNSAFFWKLCPQTEEMGNNQISHHSPFWFSARLCTRNSWKKVLGTVCGAAVCRNVIVVLITGVPLSADELWWLQLGKNLICCILL